MQNLDGLLLQRQIQADVIDLHYVYSAVISQKDRHILLVYLLNDRAVPSRIFYASIENNKVNLGSIIKSITSNYTWRYKDLQERSASRIPLEKCIRNTCRSDIG